MDNAAAKQTPQGSLLTDGEQDAQYRAVMQQARATADASGGVNSVSCIKCRCMFLLQAVFVFDPCLDVLHYVVSTDVLLALMCWHVQHKHSFPKLSHAPQCDDDNWGRH